MPVYFLPQQTHPEDVLTVIEAAKDANVCKRTIHRWLDSGELPAAQSANNRWRIRRGDLDRFLRTHTGRSEYARPLLSY